VSAPRDVTAINLPTDDGRLTVLAHHQPLICSLTDGETLISTEDGARETWATGQGAISVENNKATLLVRSAERSKNVFD